MKRVLVAVLLCSMPCAAFGMATKFLWGKKVGTVVASAVSSNSTGCATTLFAMKTGPCVLVTGGAANGDGGTSLGPGTDCQVQELDMPGPPNAVFVQSNDGGAVTFLISDGCR